MKLMFCDSDNYGLSGFFHKSIFIRKAFRSCFFALIFIIICINCSQINLIFGVNFIIPWFPKSCAVKKSLFWSKTTSFLRLIGWFYGFWFFWWGLIKIFWTTCVKFLKTIKLVGLPASDFQNGRKRIEFPVSGSRKGRKGLNFRPRVFRNEEIECICGFLFSEMKK